MPPHRNPLQDRTAEFRKSLASARQATDDASRQEYENLITEVCNGFGRTDLSVPLKLVELTFDEGKENSRAEYVLKREKSRWDTKYTVMRGSGFQQFKAHVRELAEGYFDEKCTRVQSKIMQGASSDDSDEPTA